MNGPDVVSAYDVLRRYGPGWLAVFLGVVALFLALHLIRAPFVAISGGLDAVMRRVDAAVTTRVTATPYTPHQGTQPGGTNRQERPRRAGFTTTHERAGGHEW